jgi:hypothetical protein
MADFIEESAIPVCMVGLLYALPNTQLTRRLAAEGRLHEGHDLMLDGSSGDQCTLGINFDPKRPMRDVLRDYKDILERVYDPAAYAGRLTRLAALMDRSGRRAEPPETNAHGRLASIETVHRIINAVPGTREVFWQAFVNCAKANPAALRYIVMLMAMYIHLGPFSRRVIAEIDRRIVAEDVAAPPAMLAPVYEAATAAAM